jgi:hypothetical protein
MANTIKVQTTREYSKQRVSKQYQRDRELCAVVVVHGCSSSQSLLFDAVAMQFSGIALPRPALTTLTQQLVEIEHTTYLQMPMRMHLRLTEGARARGVIEGHGGLKYNRTNPTISSTTTMTDVVAEAVGGCDWHRWLWR